MLADLSARPGRDWAWDQAALAVEAIDRAGCSGAVLTGLRFETVVGEAAEWRRRLVGEDSPLGRQGPESVDQPA
jgi:hypothetical protein